MLAGLVLTGCGANAEPAATSSAETTQADVAKDDTARDAAACKAVSDVMTIADNVDIALSEGRMAAQEQRGWYDVATRVLDRIPSTGNDAVSLGVADLKEAAPPLTPGTGAEPLGIGSDAWYDALATLDEPCLAADAELTIHVFTGG